MKRRWKNQSKNKTSLEYSLKKRRIFENVGRIDKKSFIEAFIIFISVFIFSLIIIYAFIPNIKPAPKYSDAFYYVKNAKLFTNFYKHPFHYFFGLLFNNLSQNELLKIGFNHYSDFDTFFRAPVYIAYLGLWILIFGDSTFSLVSAQVFIFCLMITVLYFLVKLMINQKYAIGVVILNLFYFPYYGFLTMCYTETMQSLLVLAFIYFIYKNNKTNKLILPLFLFLLVLSKVALKFLYLLYVPAVIYIFYLKEKKISKEFKKNVRSFLLFFFAFLLFWKLISSHGKINNMNIQGFRNIYYGSCFYSDGFFINTQHHLKEFRDNINKVNKNMFWFNRYSTICKYALMEKIKKHPLKYISITFKKIGYFLLYPPDIDYMNKKYPKLLQSRYFISQIYHILLIFLSFFTFYFLKEPVAFLLKLIFLILLFYISSIFGQTDSYATRYFLPLSPLVSIFVIFFIRYMKNINLKWLFVYALFCLSILFMNIIKVFIFNPIGIRIIQFVFCNSIFFIMIYLFIFKINNKKNMILNIFISLFIFVIFNSFILKNPYLNHFYIKSDSIIEKIILPERWKKNSYNFSEAYILIDIKDAKNKFININLNELFKTNISISKTNYFGFGNFKKDYWLDYEKQWIAVRIPLSVIKLTNVVKIYTPASVGFRYTKGNKIFIPSIINFMTRAREDTTFYFLRNNMERRVFLPTHIYSKRRNSSLNNKNYDYNIFIVLKEKGDYYIPSIYEKLNNANVKFIALLNPVDKGIVKWREQYIPGLTKVTNELYKYLAGEIDRFDSHYRFY